jgi:hypothetical protein
VSTSIRLARVVCTTLLVVCALQMTLRTASYADGGASEHGRTVTVRSSSDSDRSGGRPTFGSEPVEHPSVYCTYTYPSLHLVAGLMGGPGPGIWWIVTCFGDNLNSSDDSAIIWLSVPGGSDANGRAPFLLAQKAVSSITLPLPLIRTNPSTTTFVNLQTWFWIDSSVWREYSATARSGESVATAVASPVAVTFSAGDGTSFSCSRGGTPYVQGNLNSSRNTTCAHTYRSSSAGEPTSDDDADAAAFPVTAIITWSITWTMDGTMIGSLPAITTTSESNLRVAQIESVEDS